MTGALLEVAGLSKSFPVKAGGFAGQAGRQIRAVYNVSFTLLPGQTLGLVGESGCGKSTTGRLVLRLIEPTAGSVKLEGVDVLAQKGAALRRMRRRMQIIFQDPQGSLNPRQTVQQIIEEPLLVHGIKKQERLSRVAQLLSEVELPPDAAGKYPHEFSGGQRQRVAICRALALKPALVVADEPVSALDASIQSQILALLQRLQRSHGTAYLLISHDLAVVRFMCHDVAVMYLGEIAEYGPAEAVYHTPRHPYTRALLQAVPVPEPHAKPAKPLGGILPSNIDPPAGCVFSTRCPEVMPICLRKTPPAFDCGPGHIARCWLNETAAGAS